MKVVFAYLKNILELHRKVLIWPINKLIQNSNPRISVAAANFKFRIKGSDLRISYETEQEIFSINDNGKIQFFGNLIRGLGLYENGLFDRGKKLFDSYLLKNVNFEIDDVVVDCGANYGDLWLSLDGKIKPTSYITFEPGSLEHESIKLNAPNGTHHKIGLSNKEDIVRFYVNEKDGDSSIIEPSEYSHFTDIKTTTLSSYVKSTAIDRVKLFKLEAEGFEPEILEGSEEILSKVDYIAVDGGNERGKNYDETLSKLCNSLFESNFEMISINLPLGRALFKNRNF